MKTITFSFILISFTFLSHGQSNKFVTVNELKDNNGLAPYIFSYPQFTEGKVIFKDNESVSAKMNFHRLFAQVLYISPKNDTLALAHPETFKNIVIGTDTFYFFNGHYIVQQTHFPSNNLFVKQTIKFVGKEKAGAYGSYSSVSSVNSSSTFSTDDNTTIYLGLDENQIYKVDSEVFLSDNANNFIKPTKKNIIKLFPNRENEIKDFLSGHAINFTKQSDLERLLGYITSL